MDALLMTSDLEIYWQQNAEKQTNTEREIHSVNSIGDATEVRIQVFCVDWFQCALLRDLAKFKYIEIAVKE